MDTPIWFGKFTVFSMKHSIFEAKSFSSIRHGIQPTSCEMRIVFIYIYIYIPFRCQDCHRLSNIQPLVAVIHPSCGLVYTRFDRNGWRNFCPGVPIWMVQDPENYVWKKFICESQWDPTRLLFLALGQKKRNRLLSSNAIPEGCHQNSWEMLWISGILGRFHPQNSGMW